MNSHKRSPFLIVFYLLSICMISFMAPAQQLDESVMKAYELRMDGKADAALDLLQQNLVADAENAAVWYERARTQDHIALGNPGSMMETMEESRDAAEKAAALEPDNLIYAIYKAKALGKVVYIALHQNAPDTQEKVQRMLAAYERVLELKPDYHEARLALVEYLKLLPPDKGGDAAKAEEHTTKLEKADVVLGAQARDLMLQDDADRVAFWKTVLDGNPDNADVIERLGKACLYADQTEKGIDYLEQAIQMDQDKNTVHLDIARHFMYQAMRDRSKLNALLPRIEAGYQAYLESTPEPVKPMKAYAIGGLSRVLFPAGQRERADELQVMAMTLDPNYSKATGIPDQNLFIPPSEIPHGFSYFSRPY